MSGTLTYSDQLTIISCGACSINFAIPSDLHKKKVNNGTDFWCPNGCKISYGEHVRSEKEKLERQLRNTRASLTAARDQAEAAERSARAYKGVATRVKNRAAHGVCPVPGCKRSFANVARHVAGQHPDFVPEHAAGGEQP
jgi:hypothetical protein